MHTHSRRVSLLLVLITSCLLMVTATAAMAAPPGGGGKGNGGLDTIKSRDWGETPVRKILQAFAWGGLATDAQIEAWADMSPEAAVAEILTFDAVNPALSPPGASDDSSLHCGSLEALQAFWSSDDPGNLMKYADRYRYATLNGAQDLSTANLQRTWTKAISTRGCNPFLYKMVLYLTNYHASISAHKTRAGLIRAYHDDIMQALTGGVLGILFGLFLVGSRPATPRWPAPTAISTAGTTTAARRFPERTTSGANSTSCSSVSRAKRKTWTITKTRPSSTRPGCSAA